MTNVVIVDAIRTPVGALGGGGPGEATVTEYPDEVQKVEHLRNLYRCNEY